jgi:hypothetical protein
MAENKYSTVHNMVMELTDDAVLRTFFTLYFMADNDIEQAKIEQSFWAVLEELPSSEKSLMKEKLRKTLFNVQPIVEELGRDVEVYLAHSQPKKAA